MSEVSPDPDRQAGLADTTRSDEADQAGRGELLSQLGKLAAAADEARRFSGQVARAVGGPSHGEQEGTTAARSRRGSAQHRISNIADVCAPPALYADEHDSGAPDPTRAGQFRRRPSCPAGRAGVGG